VVSYFKNGKVPVWTFDEVQKDTLDLPLGLVVKEVASKINRHAFNLRAPDAKAFLDGVKNSTDYQDPMIKEVVDLLI
jgi:hypothetical protein